MPTFTSPDVYTPRHLAEKILTSKAALEGERKLVTVLFADLKGSMQLLADRDPEEARKLLDPVLERMMEAVHRYEGTVNQVMGDGIMALFGAPVAHEDHAVRACYAALRMQDAVKRYAGEVQHTQGPPVHIRIGLNSGEVVVRSIGSDLRMDYSAVGQTTHLAARMEQLASPGSILLTSDTLQLAEGYVQVKDWGPVPVKGLADPVPVYEVTGATTARSRLHAAAAGGLTRFVGRDAELAELGRAADLARAGHGQVVAVVGEPGVGKSRLYWEFTRSHRAQRQCGATAPSGSSAGWLILESGSVSYGKAIAYLPVIDLLKAYFQVEARDDVGKIRAKVTAKVLSLDRQLEPFVPALLSLLDALPDDPHWARLDPSQRRQKTLDSVKRLLFRESQMQPLLVLFEDLHWIDSETQALLDILVESLPGARVLLLVNYRPEYSHGWGSKTYYRQLRIDSLAPQSAQELLQPFLGDDPSLEPLKRILIERTEGNPLFLEESARTIVDTHVLVGHRGAYRLPNDAHSIQIPITVQAILAARIDRLPPEDKRLLQAAAVIGKDVPFDLLEAIAELPDEELRRGLTRLQASELVYEARLFPDLEYTFKHALTHEVAYGSLLHERRRELHARIVVTLERLHANRLDEHMERLGHHALQAGLMARAVPYLRRAGMRAFLKSANREAAAWFERALTALRQLPEDRATAELGIDLRIDLRHALFQLGEWSRVHDYLVEADALAQTLGDHRREGQVASFLVNYFTNRGDPARAIDSGHQALRAARAAGDAALEGATNFYLSNAFHALGDYERATAVSRGNVEVLDRVSTGEHYFVHAPLLSVLSRASWARSIAERGELVEAIAHADESVRLAAATERPFHIVFTLLASGGVRLVKGDPDEAIRLLERGLALAQEANIPLFAPQCAALLGHAYMLSARLPEALPLLEEAAGPAGSAQQLGGHARRVAYLSEAYLAAGRVAEAAQLAEQARALAREHQERGNEAHVLRVLGEVAAHRDRPEAEVAADHYDQARALASELGMRPLVAHCHLGLGQLYGHTGQREQGLGHLATARAMYREMEMGYWLEQAEVEFEDLKQAGKEHGS